MPGPATELRLRKALWELAEASESLRGLDLALDSGEEMGEDTGIAEVLLERYLVALAMARKLGRSEE